MVKLNPATLSRTTDCGANRRLLTHVRPETFTRFSHSYPSNSLSSRHLLRHMQQDALVFRIRSTEEPTKLRQHPRFLTRGSEQLGIGFSLRQTQQLRWFFAIIKQLIHR